MVSHQSGSFVLRDSTLSAGLVDTSLQLTLFAFISAGNQILRARVGAVATRRRSAEGARPPAVPALCRRSGENSAATACRTARQRRRQREPLDSRQAPTASTACAAVARTSVAARGGVDNIVKELACALMGASP